MSAAKSLNGPAIQSLLSAPRMSTYLAVTGQNTQDALELYGWNARMSAALMLPAHFAEVAARNAVDGALTAVYGPRWPWHPGFTRSLPTSPPGFYDPRVNLEKERAKTTTPGKVIAELNFIFWEKMFTARFDERVWNSQILTHFPNAAGQPAKVLRDRVRRDLEVIRKLRNRVAHHEPIFTRDLASELNMMVELVSMRSAPAVAWVRTLEDASTILAQKP